jgi:hypothetical protein
VEDARRDDRGYNSPGTRNKSGASSRKEWSTSGETKELDHLIIVSSYPSL